MEKTPRVEKPVPVLLTPIEVAQILQVPAGTLSQWRYRKTGPPYLRIGHHVRYDQSSLTAWIGEQAA